MTEKVNPVLLPRQRLVDVNQEHECTGCGRKFAEGEKAIYTPPTWPPSYNSGAQLICAACYVPPGRHERFTDDGTGLPPGVAPAAGDSARGAAGFTFRPPSRPT